MADPASSIVYEEREVVWLTIIGSASIQIRADDKYFEPDVRRSIKKIKNLEIQLRVDADISKASKKIRDLRYRITSKDAVLKVDADVSKAETKLAALLDRFVNNQLVFDVVADTAAADAALSDLQSRFGGTTVPFNATTNAAGTNALLDHAARDRIARIRPIIDPAARAALMAALNILAGTLPIDKVRAALLGLVTNFEGIATKSSLVVTALGAIGAAALTAGANLFAIVGDAAQVLGLFAALPIAVATTTAVLKANKMAWLDFGTAAKDNSAAANKALAKLPPEAQKAAKALRGVREEIQEPVQNAFWAEMGPALQNMVSTQLPSVIHGMTRVGTGWSTLTKEVFNTVEGLGDFSNVFENIADGVFNMHRAVKPAVESLSTFVRVGSGFLPEFGVNLSEAVKRFGEFTKEAEASGQIVSWIRVGVQRLQELGSVASSTIGIFNGLANAARLSGSEGLTGLAVGMENVANIVNGEPFQSQLVSMLEGARSGTEKLGVGFRVLTSFIGDSADSIGLFLDKAGEVAALTFPSITALFAGTGLGTGLMDMMDGLGEAIRILQPGFSDLGSAMGGLAEIAGELLVNTASGLNMLFSTVDGVVSGLKDGIIAVMPVLNSFVQALLSVAAGPIIAVAEAVGNVLEWFATLPSVVQYAAATIGLFLLLGPKIIAMWSGVQVAASRVFANMATDAVAGGGRIQNAFGRNVSAIGDAWRNVGATIATGNTMSGFLSATDRMSMAAGSAASAIGTTANQGLRAAGNGLMGLLGGPWGAAVAGATVLVGLYANAQAEARARVDELKGSLDQQTGAATAASQKIMVGDLIDYESGKDGWSEFWRFGRKTAIENMDEIGLSADEVTKKLTDPKTGTEYADAWRQIGQIATSSIGGTLTISDELARSVGRSREELEGMGAQDLSTMAGGINSVAKTAQTAAREIQDLADRTKTNTIVATQLAKNYDTLKLATSSASDKFQALKQNIDLLSGSQRTAHSAARDYAQSVDDQKKAMTDLITTHGGAIDSTGKVNDAFRGTLLNADKTFSTATQGARDFSTQMDIAADTVLKKGTAALDAALKSGKAMPEAMAIAMAEMGPAVDTLRQSLQTMGFDAGQVDAIIKQLGLDPEKLTAAMSVDTQQAELDVARLKISMASYADGNYTAVLAALPQAAKDALTDTMGLGDKFATGDYTAILNALDLTPGKREAALAAMMAYDGTDWVSFLKAQNLVGPEVAKANADAAKLATEKNIVLRAEDLTTDILESVNAYALHDKTALFKADDKVTDVLGRVNNSTLADKTNTLGTTDLVSQMIGKVNDTLLENKLNKLQTEDLVTRVLEEVNAKTLNGKKNTLSTDDLATIVVENANKVLLGDKLNTIKTNDNATPVVRGANSFILNDKTANITGNRSPFNSVMESVRNTIMPTLTVPVYAQYAGASNAVKTLLAAGMTQANGGIVNGSGVQTFAKGGILNSAVKAYAGGGVENHVAQIARGAWPVRIWAEPETGGEAYIPLSKNKRKRSLEILRQVMDQFGLSSFAQFADGGFNKPSYATPSVVSSRYSTSVAAAEIQKTTSTTPASVVNFTVNPSQGLSEQQIGESAMRELYWQIANR